MTPWSKGLLTLRENFICFVSLSLEREDMYRWPLRGHLMGKSQLANVEFDKGRDELPACPKPCRPGPAASEFLYPLSCKHSCSSHQESGEILSMISTKGNEGRESMMSTGCPPSCYCGSPPTRLDNPLVHDGRFIHQAELLQSPVSRKLFGSFGFTSATPI